MQLNGKGFPGPLPHQHVHHQPGGGPSPLLLQWPVNVYGLALLAYRFMGFFKIRGNAKRIVDHYFYCVGQSAVAITPAAMPRALCGSSAPPLKNRPRGVADTYCFGDLAAMQADCEDSPR